MLNAHTLNQLRSLRLDGMVHAIEEQATSTAATALGFDERLSMLVQREVAWRDARRVERLLKAAKLKVSAACVGGRQLSPQPLPGPFLGGHAGQRRLDTQRAQFAHNGRDRLRQDMACMCTGAPGRKVRLLGAVRSRWKTV